MKIEIQKLQQQANLITEISKAIGEVEIVGKNHNQNVVDFFAECGHSWVKDDETPWCAAAHNAIHIRSGLPHTKKLNARSWRKMGAEINLANAKPFCDTVVLWRKSKDSVFGHVGFYVNHNSKYVWLAGGNQGNEYNISKYPLNRILNVRTLFP